MATDPVCKMMVDEAKAPYSFEYKGEKYYFCGLGCKERFERHADKYLTGEIVDWIKDE